MKTKRFLSLLLSVACLCAAAIPGAAIASAADTTPEFTDVTDTTPHNKAIMYCAQNKFVNGVSPTKFNPAGELTREQMALIWARTFNVEYRPHNYRDVSKINSEGELAILYLHGRGIINGVSPTEYGRNTAVTREQAITIAARTYLDYEYDGKDADAYDDSDKISSWAYESVSKCLKAGELKNLFVKDNLYPQNPITRGELCHLIYNIMGGDEITPTPEPSEEEPTPEPSEEEPTPEPSEKVPTPEPSEEEPTPET